MRFNPKARLDTRPGQRHRSRRRWRVARAAAGCASRSPAAPAGGGIGGMLIVVLIIVLTQCLGGGDGTGARHRRLDTSRLDDAARHRPLRQLPDRRGRQRGRRLRPGRGRELALRLLVRRCRRSPARSSSPSGELVTFTGAVDTGCGQATSAVGPFYCPADQRSTSTPTFFDDVLRAPARRPGRRVRRALRARPRVRPPHPEPARHHGPGAHPAGPAERRRTPRAAGRLLRRHVGQARHRPPRTPRARC